MRIYLLLLVFFLVSWCTSLQPRTQVSEEQKQVEKTQVKNEQTTEVALPNIQSSWSQVCVKDICFVVEIADDAAERAQGLMRRANMDIDKGMRFIFDEPTAHAAFWMKNTLIPLDMIWVNNDMQIIALVHNATPCKEMPCPSYDPWSWYARYVLEINAWLAQQYGLSTWDSVVFEE